MRTKKAMLNMAMSLAYQIIAIICGLITPRLILLNFGSTYNGVVSSATQFLYMVNFLTLGITASTRVALYKTLSDKDSLGTSRLVKATKNYMRHVTFGVVIYAAVLCIIYPYISHNDLTYLQSSTLIAIVSIGTFADCFFCISYNTLLQADQASYVTYTLNIIKTVLNTICVTILIFFGSSIYIVKLGSSLVYLITPALLNLYVKKKYNLINNCEPDNTGIKQRGAVAFHAISNIVHDNTDLVVLTLFTDAKLISVYTVYYLVIGKIKSMMQVLTSGMEAAFGEMWVKHEIKALQRNFRAFEYILFTFTTIVFSCVGVLIIPFVTVYTRGITDINYTRISLAVLITLTEAMYCIRQPYLTLVYSTGKFEETKWGAAAEAIINLGLSIILVNFVGINGVIIGTLISNIFRTTQFAFFVSKNVLNRSISLVLKRFIWVVICLAMIVSISLFIESRMAFVSTWGLWFVEAIIVLCISCVITLIMSLLFYRSDFLYLLNKLKFMLIRNH
jgi:Polysaccharide biosynthesis protein.